MTEHAIRWGPVLLAGFGLLALGLADWAIDRFASRKKRRRRRTSFRSMKSHGQRARDRMRRDMASRETIK